MKRRIFMIALVIIAIINVACNDQKKTSEENSEVTKKEQKANLIDGKWEMDYMIPQEKSLDSLYPESKPSLTINSEKSQISGMTGCNNFSGGLTIDGKQFKIAENLALTRKMCPDMTGEDTFLKNLEKADAYSVSNRGNTLNLIMGDIAIMRFQRK
ncbi:META domain-containing protein [Gramella lutea]|uniref:META domain-containing protein n=1 Tax=Christiangramia lutea TaxID=1607951 RepID=A0A9X2AC86_9FLAO|nr:META domain-containing protein [Christiangramia lutea]MCH4823858.1 META domain-containing protein [Christiangramia lutea]